MSNVLQLKNELARYLGITIEHSPAELGSGGQRQAGVVKLVTIVTDADLKLDGIVNILEECGWVKLNKEGELPFPEKFLWDNVENIDGSFVCVIVGIHGSTASPRPPAGHLMGCRHSCAPACLPVL